MTRPSGSAAAVDDVVELLRLCQRDGHTHIHVKKQQQQKKNTSSIILVFFIINNNRKTQLKYCKEHRWGEGLCWKRGKDVEMMMMRFGCSGMKTPSGRATGRPGRRQRVQLPHSVVTPPHLPSSAPRLPLLPGIQTRKKSLISQTGENASYLVTHLHSSTPTHIHAHRHTRTHAHTR